MPQEQTTHKFTSWAELHSQMLDDLASGAWRTLASYSLGNRSFAYRSLKEFRELLDFIRDEAAKESGSPRYLRRTFARQGGRG